MKRLTNKQLLVVLVAVVIILAVLLSMGARQNRNKNGEVVREAIVQAQEATTMHVKTDFTMHLPERLRSVKRPFTEVTVAIEGDVVRTDEAAPELVASLDGNLRGPGNAFFFNGDVYALNDSVAFRLDEFPTLLNPSGSLVNKWTYIDTVLLQTGNVEAITGLLLAAVDGLNYQGVASVNDAATLHYIGTFSEEEQQIAADVLRAEASNNEAWDAIARLLDAHELKQVDVHIDRATKEFAAISLSFHRPLQNGDTFDVAELTIALTDYNQPVTIERPEKQATVRPGVFSKLLGAGEVEGLPVESTP